MTQPPDGPALALRRSLVSESREQHSVVVIERRTDVHAHGARVMPILEKYARRGTLNARQCRAGEMIYECWSIGIAGAHDSDAGGSSMPDPSGIRDKQLDAATEYRRVRDALGLRMWPVVWAVCVEDMSVDQFANERGGTMDRKQWMGVLRVALSIAADHLGL